MHITIALLFLKNEEKINIFVQDYFEIGESNAGKIIATNLNLFKTMNNYTQH